MRHNEPWKRRNIASLAADREHCLGLRIAFNIAAGGGLNFLLTDHVALRALQADYYRPLGGFYHSADFLRLGFGISYQFGSR